MPRTFTLLKATIIVKAPVHWTDSKSSEILDMVERTVEHAIEPSVLSLIQNIHPDLVVTVE
jgi:hypothetical protein